jgi:hypothetical protein
LGTGKTDIKGCKKRRTYLELMYIPQISRQKDKIMKNPRRGNQDKTKNVHEGGKESAI